MGEIEKSDLLYKASPAGFKVAEDKSAPTAEYAPPSPRDLAVPTMELVEYLSASDSFCPNPERHKHSVIMETRENFLMIRLENYA